MSLLTVAAGPPSTQPLLGDLVGGFVLLVVGLAVLTRRRSTDPLASREGTRRAALAVLFYGMFASCFARILAPALLGREQSPWLLALGDVLAVTIGLFVWVVLIAEARPWQEYGLKATAGARLGLTLALGIGAAIVLSWRSYGEVLSGELAPTPDSFVFAFLFAVVGSAIPEELLFRGWLQGSLEGRANRWARLAFPALAFAVVRSLRLLPGVDVPFDDWLFHSLGIALPLGLWWGLMRDLAGGSIWPGIVSHVVLEFGTALAGASPTAPPTP